MQSKKKRITISSVNSLQPGDVIWDDKLPRFGARCRRNGTTFFVKVRIDKRQRWITIGRLGPLTTSEARDQARKILAEVDSGSDPAGDRDYKRTIPSVREFSNKWLKLHVRPKRAASTATEYNRLISLHVLPHLGDMRIDRVESKDILELQSQFSDRPYLGNRIVAVLSSLMTFAEQMKTRPRQSNPCRGIERFKEAGRKRPLQRDELLRVWRHLEEHKASFSPQLVGAVQFLILTGMRKEEALNLKWSDVLLDDGTAKLPTSKTGARSVVLPPAALDLLTNLPRFADNPYVFIGVKAGQRLVNITKFWHRIRRELNLNDVRIHDFRHTVASHLARSSPLPVVRDALGHKHIATTSKYSHSSEDDVRAALSHFSGQLVEGHTNA